MVRYRKKPVIIEAEQWLPCRKYDGVSPSVEMPTPPIPCEFLLLKRKYWLFGKQEWWIKTLEGELKPNSGDWIIKGVQGEYYPCKPDIFEKTYELVK